MAVNAKKILVPVKGDRAGEDAFRLACELSRDTKARLYGLYVIEVQQELPIDIDADTTQGEAILTRIEALSREEKYPVDATYIQARHAGPAIVQEVMERGDRAYSVRGPLQTALRPVYHWSDNPLCPEKRTLSCNLAQRANRCCVPVRFDSGQVRSYGELGKCTS